MSKRHFDNYYNEIAGQYQAMSEQLKRLQQKSTTEMISPEVIENMQTILQPIKSSYEILSYVKYLFNMPNKSKKKKSYERSEKKKLRSVDYANTQQGVVQQNNAVLDKAKEMIDG